MHNTCHSNLHTMQRNCLTPVNTLPLSGLGESGSFVQLFILNAIDVPRIILLFIFIFIFIKRRLIEVSIFGVAFNITWSLVVSFKTYLQQRWRDSTASLEHLTIETKSVHHLKIIMKTRVVTSCVLLCFCLTVTVTMAEKSTPPPRQPTSSPATHHHHLDKHDIQNDNQHRRPSSRRSKRKTRGAPKARTRDASTPSGFANIDFAKKRK